MSDKIKISKMVKAFQKSKQRIAKERDFLRDHICEMDEIADDCDVAICNLEEAIDALSKYL